LRLLARLKEAARSGIDPDQGFGMSIVWRRLGAAFLAKPNSPPCSAELVVFDVRQLSRMVMRYSCCSSTNGAAMRKNTSRELLKVTFPDAGGPSSIPPSSTPK
jgi:hypothetical protein